MKKLLCAFCASVLICTSAYASPLYTKTSKETVTGGVSHTNVQKFYGDYALNIDLITADLKNEYISMDLLKSSKGCDKTDTVLNLANSEENVVAATNADFFSSYKGDQNFSLGIEIKDGELLQSHIKPEMAAGFMKNGALIFSYLEFSGVVTAPNGAVQSIAHINKPTDYYGAVLMYTPDFNGGTSPFLPEGITALTVENGVVTAKGTSLGGVIPIPENGYILVLDDKMTPFLEYNFNIGDTVKTDLSTAQITNGVEMAFGGGTLLLKDGVKTPITHNVSGNNPRTAIGTNSDGTVVYLLTVDGRQNTSRGVTLETLADICIEMGMANALNLDGGGSTAMVAKTLSNDALHHINSPSEKRKVINGVAVTSSAVKGEATGLIASCEKTNILSGDSTKLYITPYDKNYNKPASTPSHEWKIAKGSGTVKNDIYYAAGSGETVLDVYLNGKKADSVKLNVITEVCGINGPTELSLTKGAEAKLGTIEVFDKDGVTAKVTDLSLLKPACDTSFLSVNGAGAVKALREGSGEITLTYGGAKRSIKVVCGEFDVNVTSPVTLDNLHTEESGGVVFNILGFDGEGTALDRLVFKKSMDTFRSAGICAVVGSGVLSDFTPKTLSPLTAQAWKEYNHDYAKVISVNLTDGNVFGRGDDWRKLKNAISSASQKNIFILMDKKAGFVTYLDKLAFYDMTESAAKDKNVFVVYNGDENAVSIRNGVRYIAVSDSKDISGIIETMNGAKYLSFNLTSYGATYTFKPLYEAFSLTTSNTSDATISGTGGMVLE